MILRLVTRSWMMILIIVFDTNKSSGDNANEPVASAGSNCPTQPMQAPRPAASPLSDRFERLSANLLRSLEEAGGSQDQMDNLNFKLDKIRERAYGIDDSEHAEVWERGIASVQDSLGSFEEGDPEGMIEGFAKMTEGFGEVVPGVFGIAITAMSTLVLSFMGVAEDEEAAMIKLMDKTITKKLDQLKEDFEETLDKRELSEMMGEIEGVKRNMNQMRNLLLSGMDAAAKGLPLTPQDIEFVTCQVSVVEGAEVMGKLKVFTLSHSRKANTPQKGKRVVGLLDAYAKLAVLRTALLNDARLFYDVANMTVITASGIERSLKADKAYNAWVDFMVDPEPSQVHTALSLAKYPNKFLEMFLESHKSHPLRYNSEVLDRCFTLNTTTNAGGMYCPRNSRLCFDECSNGRNSLNYLRCIDDRASKGKCLKTFSCVAGETVESPKFHPSFLYCDVGCEDHDESVRYPLIRNHESYLVPQLKSSTSHEKRIKLGVVKIDGKFHLRKFNPDKTYSPLYLSGFNVVPRKTHSPLPGFDIIIEDC